MINDEILYILLTLIELSVDIPDEKIELGLYTLPVPISIMNRVAKAINPLVEISNMIKNAVCRQLN